MAGTNVPLERVDCSQSTFVVIAPLFDDDLGPCRVLKISRTAQILTGLTADWAG